MNCLFEVISTISLKKKGAGPTISNNGVIKIDTAAGLQGAGTKTKDLVTASGISAQEVNDVEDRDVDQQWEIIENPTAAYFASHFHLQLGWGCGRFTLFRWDFNIRTDSEP